MVSLHLALSPQFASLVGAGVMLLLMMKVGHFFYELPNVSGPAQITKPRKTNLQIAPCWVALRRIAFSLSPVVAPGTL